MTRPLCTVCKHWEEGDACAHHACPGRSLKPRSIVAVGAATDARFVPLPPEAGVTLSENIA